MGKYSERQEEFHTDWFNPWTGEIIDGGGAKRSEEKSFTAPLIFGAALYLFNP